MNCDNTLEEVFYKYLSHNDMKKNDLMKKDTFDTDEIELAKLVLKD